MKTVHYEIQPKHLIYATEDTKYESFDDVQRVDVHEIENASDLTGDIVAGTLELLAKAYAHQFENQGPKLPKGTFNRFFDSGSSAVGGRQSARMEKYIEEGSIYGFVFDPENNDRQIALGKISPSQATPMQKLHLRSPNAYINDIAVDPDHQNKRLGSLVLYHLLTRSKFDGRRNVALDGFVGNNQANEWFQRLGLRRVDVELDPLEVDHHDMLVLPQERYSSEGLAHLEDVRTHLKDSVNIKSRTV